MKGLVALTAALLVTGQAAHAQTSEKYSDAEQQAIVECIAREAQVQMSKKNRHLVEGLVSQACKKELSFWVETDEPAPSNPAVSVSAAPADEHPREDFIRRQLLEASTMYDKAAPAAAREPAGGEQARPSR